MDHGLRTPRLGACTLVLGLAASLLVALSPARAGAEIPYADTQRIPGGSAVEAGIAVSEHLYADGQASSVVLVRRDKFPDGLAAAGVAGAFDGPVLFSSSDHLDAATEAEIRRVLPPGRTVYLMGGEAALSPAIEDELGGDYVVHRAGGSDRVDTAALAAIRYTRAGPGNTAILVRGYGSPGQDAREGWVDAISCGGYAAEHGTPILLTNNTVDQVHPRTLDVLSQLNVERVLICGGFGAVPKSQSDELLQLGYGVSRFAGTTRVGTAINVARELWDRDADPADDAFVLVNGWAENFAYGIAAAPLSASLDAPLLLVDRDEPSSYVAEDCPGPPNVNHETLCYLNVHHGGSGRIGSLTVVGSTALVSDAVFAAAAEAGGLPEDSDPPSVPGNVTATDAPEDDGTNLEVTWAASTDDSGGDITYTVYVREASEDAFTTDSATVAGTVDNATELTVTGRAPGTEYEVALTATDAFGRTSELSEPAAATPTDEVPDAPTAEPNLQGDPGRIIVAWIEAPEADAAGYLVERAAPGVDNPVTPDVDESCEEVWGASYEQIARVEGRTTTSHEDSAVESGERYCYRYRVFDTTYDPGSHPPSEPSPAKSRTAD